MRGRSGQIWDSNCVSESRYDFFRIRVIWADLRHVGTQPVLGKRLTILVRSGNRVGRQDLKILVLMRSS